MTGDERQRRMDAARVHAELSVKDLWLRYVALGGAGDVFDLDGYLQGLLPLEAFQQEILAQALNESLEDGYRSYLIPLSTPLFDDAPDDRLSRLVAKLLEELPATRRVGSEPPSDGPP
jgi:hypothetical protein